MPIRYDVGTLGDIERTPQGGLRIPAFPTRIGVFSYGLPDGSIRREYRPAEEVLDPASLATLAHAPVTDLHPEQDGVRIPVTPSNYRDLAVGHVAEDVRPQGDHVAATVLVQDQGMIQKIENQTRRECSAGYNCILDPTPGVTGEGEVYDAIQRQIRYNHLALGPKDWGRAGSTVALRLDSGDAIQQPEVKTVEETIDGVVYKVGTAEWSAAKNKYAVKLIAERDQAIGRADAAEATAKKQADALPSQAQVKAQIAQRVRLITDCKRAADKAKARFDEEAAAVADEDSLIVEAIQMLDPSFDPKGKTPDYLKGFFASLIKGLGAEEASEPTSEPATLPAGSMPAQKTDAKKTIFSVREGTKGGDRQDSAGPDPDKAKADMVAKNRDAWKKPLGRQNKN